MVGVSRDDPSPEETVSCARSTPEETPKSGPRVMFMTETAPRFEETDNQAIS